jgi:hypothetical protein
MKLYIMRCSSEAFTCFLLNAKQDPFISILLTKLLSLGSLFRMTAHVRYITQR